MKKQLHKNISEIWKDEYVVPLYQRNFSWIEEQIRQLIQDIYEHHNDKGNYYLGSLIVLQRNDMKYEVIDGQQRLTALQIISKALGILNEPRLHYDSRPEVETFFLDLFNSKSCEECYKLYCRKGGSKIYRLIDALRIVQETKIRNSEGIEVSFEDFPQDTRLHMAEYLRKRVMLIRVPLPQDTDVAAYFEIMNNRGEQLQAHEVIKALIMGKAGLTAQQREVFATVWDACSQMDVPIHKSLGVYRKNNSVGRIFGDNYDTLQIELLDQYNKDASEIIFRNIDQIIVDKTPAASNDKHEQDLSRFSSIIDFPNFLTHVFKMYDSSVELNGDNLDKAFKRIAAIIEPMEFIKRLLIVRTLFDRYVVKVHAENEEDENLTWVMHRPYLSKEGSLKYKNTFSVSEEADDNESEGDVQRRIIKQLSMLQVSFRNRKYKNWLFSYLSWLYENYKDNVNGVNPDIIITKLDTWIENHYKNNIESRYIDETGENVLLKSGVDTPHFLFNFIDYLYWLEKEEKRGIVRYTDEVQDFKFRYYNSVEHHRPQSYDKSEINADMIGNLCLISRRNNSSLNDKDAREKIKGNKDLLQPKRRIMYKITELEHDWNKKQIEEHQIDIITLLNDRVNVLKLNN